MKTAIIYRSNPTLDTMLAGLKDKVDLFHVFPAGTDAEEIKDQFESSLYEILYTYNPDPELGITETRSTFDRIICDLTCYQSLNLWCEHNIYVVNQCSEGPHEEYIRNIAHEACNTGMDVVIVRDCLAHHCQLDGVDPYSLGNDRDGWYLEKVIETWTRILQEESVSVRIISKDISLTTLVSKIVVCDHHNAKLSDELEDLENSGVLILKSSYSANAPANLINPDDIPILFKG